MLAADLLTEGISEEKKEGILWGMELMGLQTEKWFDNDEHANAYRNDTVEGCGFSGWKETVLFTRGFLDAEQPESDENEGISMIVDDGSETSDMELTDDETDEGFEIVDDEEDEYDSTEWMPYIYENVEYLIEPTPEQPGNPNVRVVLETEDYQPVGVFEQGAITFEDNDKVCEHFDRVRETTVPEDPEEAVELITEFIKDNYTLLDYRVSGGKDFPVVIAIYINTDHLRGGATFYFGQYADGGYNVLGKNMGEVMKEIEKLLM